MDHEQPDKFKEEFRMNDWSKWENHVLNELKRLNSNIEKVIVDAALLTKEQFQLKHDCNTRSYKLQSQIDIMKARLRIYAAMAGFGGSMIVPAFQLIYHFLKGS